MSSLRRFACVVAVFLCPIGASAQDLYDPAVLRTFAIQFDDADWLARLRANYASETNILADVTVDGVTYVDVGVRIRGNTSYIALPAASEKFSLKLEVDFVQPDQEILGYDEINLNNGFADPTFTREVTYNNFVARFIPNPRASHALVTLNGQNWGVYNNIQHVDKRMLRDYFEDNDGLRITCSNNPNGPGLAYAGPNASSYFQYTISADGGLADPYAPLIAVTNALSNGSLANLPATDALFAIDPSIWSVVLENLLTDDDSYINKGCDFVTYRDPLDGRMHLLQRDANETLTQTMAWTYDRNFTQTNKPLLNRVIRQVPEMRQRYLAHYRTAKRDLTLGYFGPRFAASRALIETAVQADPKRIYTFQNFQDNFTQQVTLQLRTGGNATGLAGGTRPGLEPFVTQRNTFLGQTAELVATGPIISAVRLSDDSPAPADPVYIAADVATSGTGISRVELFYRVERAGIYRRTPMRDDGASGDGAVGDGTYGALLPVNALSGQTVDFYVGAAAVNSFQSVSYLPELTERGPLQVAYGIQGGDGMRITEWMYDGVSGEFIEFTNLGVVPIDLAGWSFDDSGATPGAFGIGAFGVVQPGESVILTEPTADAFRSAWSLPVSVKVIGELGVNGIGHNLSRNDQINLYDAGGALVDRLTYGDQNIPGSIRTQNASGQPRCPAIGQDMVLQWQLSVLGDAFGSTASGGGNLGMPGTFVLVGCTPPVIFANGFE